uniref:Carbonic anhydrase n=2 Tax=Arion vulgaris TaxID=1028688 RepID=A0A0B7AKW3_9EUPU
MYAVRILLTCSIVLQGVLTAEWTYAESEGPDEWAKLFPACGKERQSPINVFEGDVILDKTIGSFVYKNYDTSIGLNMILKNNGHSAAIALSGTTPVTIEGGGLPPGSYRAYQLHFHWGDDDDLGSEHLISSTAYPMELHVVHYNTRYPSPAVAVSKPDGLAVLAFFYEVTDEDNINYSGIARSLESIYYPGSKVNIQPGRIRTLLPTTFTQFYRYSGSLTTPSCQESVTWTLFKNTIKISQSQLEGFRGLLDSHKDQLVNNFRPVQPLRKRKVTSNFVPDIHWSYKEGITNAENWHLYYSTCGADRQSPINIPTLGSRLDVALRNIQFHNYHQIPETSFKLINNGHSVAVDISTGNFSISGGGLPETYQASKFHFHWGSSDSEGSEHTLNNKAYPMEVQVIHYKKSLQKLTRAFAQPDGLAVLGFFFEISPEDNPALSSLIEGLVSIRTSGSSIDLSPFSLTSILPTTKTNFYRYSGSLTVPGCFQSVIWTIFKDTIPISESQLAAFRLLESSEEDVDGSRLQLVNNYRPVQNLNNRVVTRSFSYTSASRTYYIVRDSLLHEE